MNRLKWSALLCVAMLTACSGNGGGSASDPLLSLDSGGLDAGGPGDAGGSDGGTDAGASPDAGSPDGGIGDAGSADDAGVPDAGTVGPAGGGDWPQYRGGPEGTWLNEGTFTVAQAAGVIPLWTADAGPQGYVQPLIVGESVFVTTGQVGRVLAFDARTGASRWARTLDQTFTDPCLDHSLHPGFWDAPAFANGVLYAAAPDGNVHALDPSNGASLRQSEVATTENPPELIQSSPAVSPELGRLYVGVAAVFTCRHIPGRVISVDLTTGASRSATLTENGRVGAAVWGSIAVDAPAQRVYVTTGDPVGQPLSDVPLAQSIVALDADTLQVLDHWQNPGPGPDDNSDFGASPTLFTAADGTRLVASANKDGWLYVLRREQLSAGPLWKHRLAVGGSDPLQGEGSLVAPTFANGLLYAAGGVTPEGEPGAVVALEPRDGTLRWKHTTPGFVFAGMPAVGDVLVVVSNALDGGKSWLELLDARTGALLKRFETRGPTYGAPSVGRGLILWYPFSGQLQALRIPSP